MDISALTPELIKANNPGLSDFGSGNILALVSQCLRCAKEPTDCTICSEFCPVNAIDTSKTGRPVVSTACIKCGACIGVCPTNALASAKRTIQQVNRLALQASLRIDHLVISCERTTALLRLAALETEEDENEVAEKSDPTPEQKAAREALELIQEATASEHVLQIPCLGMITRELWFSTLNELGVSKLHELSVFLPPGLCAECPVNAKDNVEDLFGEAITRAEIWSRRSVGIITDARELPQVKRANVRAYLTSGAEVDRRGAFTGFLDELRQTWDENSKVGNKALDEVRLQRERKATFEKTRLAKDIRKGKPGGKNPIAVPTRYILIEALGRNDANAEEVTIQISATDAATCTFCGTCVSVCVLRARSLETAPSTVENEAGEKIDSPETEGTQTLLVHELYCVGCSACLQACPTESCTFTEIKGTAYLGD
jgi:ferredoxin